ncbi:MAG: cupin domain-containing protein [Gemmatimonadetes bacterium]|nr:cupin domain-containing protein [Gemmatimonadota bacterium]NNF11919.1 cupin domain-containing protein [Gemmatimonadota bacterium]
MTAAAVFLAACGQAVTAPAEDSEPVSWEAFDIAAMQSQRQGQNVSFLTVLDNRDFRMGLLHVRRGTETGLIAHRLNAVYHVVSGAARIAGDTLDVDIEPGDAVFVRGDVEHTIRDVTEDLDLVVVFRLASLSPNDPDVVSFTREEMVAGASEEGSMFNLLLSTSTLGLGMYLVPKGIGADQLMVHQAAEIKLVAEGTGRFDLGDGGIRVDPGSIAFIPSGVQHQFRRVADALEVLVVWER